MRFATHCLLLAQPDDPIDLVIIVGISPWSGTVGLKFYANGFQLLTSKNKTFNCAVDTETEKEMWIRGVTESLAWAKSNKSMPSKNMLTQEEHVSKTANLSLSSCASSAFPSWTAFSIASLHFYHLYVPPHESISPSFSVQIEHSLNLVLK